MVRENIAKYEGVRIVVDGVVGKTFKPDFDNCLISDVVIRRDGRSEHHMWVCDDEDTHSEHNEIVRSAMMKHQRVGVRVSMRGVIVRYTKRNGAVDYAIEDIDMISVDGNAYRRVD